MKINQFISPMEAHSYAKKHLHTSSIWIIILKHFNIETLTLGIPWHNLNNYIDMWLLWTYIHMQKVTLQLKLFLSYWSFKDLGIWLAKEKLGMPGHNQAETLNQLVGL